MKIIRQQLPSNHVSTEQGTAEISAESILAMINAIAVLQQHRAQLPNAQDELDEFIHHPEIIAMTK